MVWGIDGLMNGVWNPKARITAIDFAGGTVVHMSSGWSALVLCLILGPRLGFRKEIMAPHSMVLCMVGTGMLWVGWVRVQCRHVLRSVRTPSGTTLSPPPPLATAVASVFTGRCAGIFPARKSQRAWVLLRRSRWVGRHHALLWLCRSDQPNRDGKGGGGVVLFLPAPN